ncbi:MAG: hypothetical protein ACI9VR_005058 [Cognaticolwellia sp.]|jgi:hypothetical protein
MSLLILLSLACGGLNRGKAEPVKEPAVPPASTKKALSQTPGQVDLARFLGINEAVTVPPPFLARPGFGDTELQAALDQDARLTQDLGANWVRGHSATFPFLNHQAWSKDPAKGQEWADRWVKTVQSQGLEPLIMLSPWPGNKTQQATSNYLPKDSKAYLAWVESVVERYDGDGVDDMPGLKSGVHYWEVDNEPDLKAEPNAKVSKKGFCPASEYAQVLIMTSASIRKADSQAVVVGGGFYRPHTESGRAYMDQVFATEEARQAIDVLSLHVYFPEQGTGRFERALTWGKAAAPDAVIWVTETNQPSQDEKKSFVTPAWQAAMLTRMVGVSLREDVQSFYWHTLADAPAKAGKGAGGMKTHSLYAQPQPGKLVAKPAVASYQLLAARFAELGSVEILPEQGGIRFGPGGPRLIWEGSVQGKATNLVTGQVTTGRVTADAENSYWVE